jgi:hypothetical protein
MAPFFLLAKILTVPGRWIIIGGREQPCPEHKANVLFGILVETE